MKLVDPIYNDYLKGSDFMLNHILNPNDDMVIEFWYDDTHLEQKKEENTDLVVRIITKTETDTVMVYDIVYKGLPNRKWLKDAKVYEYELRPNDEMKLKTDFDNIHVFTNIGTHIGVYLKMTLDMFINKIESNKIFVCKFRDSNGVGYLGLIGDPYAEQQEKMYTF